MNRLIAFLLATLKGLIFAFIVSVAIALVFAVFSVVGSKPPLHVAEMVYLFRGTLGVGVFSVLYTFGPIFLVHYFLYANRHQSRSTFLRVSIVSGVAAAAMTLSMLGHLNGELLGADALWLDLFCLASIATLTLISMKLVWRRPGTAADSR